MEFVLDRVVQSKQLRKAGRILEKCDSGNVFPSCQKKKKEMGVGGGEGGGGGWIKPNIVVPASKSTLIWWREGFVTLLGGLNLFNAELSLKRYRLGRWSTWCLTSTETIRFIRDGEKGGRGYGGGGGGGGGGDCIPIATLSPPKWHLH